VSELLAEKNADVHATNKVRGQPPLRPRAGSHHARGGSDPPPPTSTSPSPHQPACANTTSAAAPHAASRIPHGAQSSFPPPCPLRTLNLPFTFADDAHTSSSHLASSSARKWRVHLNSPPGTHGLFPLLTGHTTFELSQPVSDDLAPPASRHRSI
jgi:hypothetical protein